jgi:hypothetical protein
VSQIPGGPYSLEFSNCTNETTTDGESVDDSVNTAGMLFQTKAYLDHYFTSCTWKQQGPKAVSISSTSF